MCSRLASVVELERKVSGWPQRELKMVPYHDIKPAEFFDGKIDGRFDILFVRHVDFNGQCFHVREPLVDQGCTSFSCW